MHACKKASPLMICLSVRVCTCAALAGTGANKGYKVPEFLALWSQRRVRHYTKGWLGHLTEYAKLHNSGYLQRRAYSCGNCGECHEAPPPPHNRVGGRVYLLEIAPQNQQLLRFLIDKGGLSDAVSLHPVGASNVTSRVQIVKTLFPGEERYVWHTK